MRFGLPAAWRTEPPFDAEALLEFGHQAHFDPIRYCEALATALVERGGQIFEGSRVETPWPVSTRPGLSLYRLSSADLAGGQEETASVAQNASATTTAPNSAAPTAHHQKKLEKAEAMRSPRPAARLTPNPIPGESATVETRWRRRRHRPT